MEEVSATIPGHSQEKEETPNAKRQPSHQEFHPSRMRRPHQKRETSVDKCLDRVQEAHQKALSAAATLEEEIERLHQIRGCSQLGVRPKSRHRWRSEGMWEERCHQASFTSEPTPSQSANPDMPPGETEPGRRNF